MHNDQTSDADQITLSSSSSFGACHSPSPFPIQEPEASSAWSAAARTRVSAGWARFTSLSLSLSFDYCRFDFTFCTFCNCCTFCISVIYASRFHLLFRTPSVHCSACVLNAFANPPFICIQRGDCLKFQPDQPSGTGKPE